MFSFTKSFSFWGTSSPRPSTGAPPLDPAGDFRLPGPQSSFMSPNNPLEIDAIGLRDGLGRNDSLRGQKFSYLITFLYVERMTIERENNDVMKKRVGVTEVA